MASEKQIAANRRNALKSTGPRTNEGKARSRLNALRHGLASAVCGATNDVAEPCKHGDVGQLYQSINRIDLARADLYREIGRLLEEPPSADLHKAVRRLGALQRYAARHLSALKTLNPNVD